MEQIGSFDFYSPSPPLQLLRCLVIVAISEASSDLIRVFSTFKRFVFYANLDMKAPTCKFLTKMSERLDVAIGLAQSITRNELQ